MSRHEKDPQESSELFTSSEFKKNLFERINGISSVFNVAYPINPKLRYEYPPVNATTLENITSALITCPKFYIQTLHLMNKMNLPCPLVSFVRQAQVDKFHLSKNTEDFMSVDSESEVESEIEMDNAKSQNIEYSLSRASKTLPPKKLKFKAFIKSKNDGELLDETSIDSEKLKIREMFEVLDDDESNKKTSKKKIKLLSEVYDRQIIQTGSEQGFAKIIPIDKKVENFEEIASENLLEPDNKNSKFINRTDLEKNRLKISELKELPIYKSYSKGERNSRIYLKNLAKGVEESDLKFIYGRYIDWENELHVNAFDIRLMQEGRMKGQAFITLPHEELASRALSETNGYLLKEKPIIISFARSAKPK